MNVQLLSKRFPELDGLSESERSALLRRAHEQAYSPEKKLQHWRRNVLSLAWVTAVSLFIMLILGPALGMPNVVSSAIIMLVILPIFMVIRHRQYAAQLRPEVQNILNQRSP